MYHAPFGLSRGDYRWVSTAYKFLWCTTVAWSMVPRFCLLESISNQSLFSVVSSERLRRPLRQHSSHSVLYPWCSWPVPPPNQEQKWGSIHVGQLLNLFTFYARILSTANGKERKSREGGERRWKGRDPKLDPGDAIRTWSLCLYLLPLLFYAWSSFSSRVLP